jgi:hypothetical protein
MKKLVVLSLFLLTYCQLFAQMIAPKGSSKAISVNNKTAKENYILLLNKCLDSDLFIASKDSSLTYVTTQVTNGRGFYYFLNLRAKDNQIEVSGKAKSGAEYKIGSVTIPDNFETITAKGMKGSLNRKAWETVEKFAKALSDSVSYQ